MENNDRHYRIVGLPGDCIGPEVYASAEQVLAVLAGRHGFRYELDDEGNEIATPVQFEVQGSALIADYFSQLEMGGQPGDLANFVTEAGSAAHAA